MKTRGFKLLVFVLFFLFLIQGISLLYPKKPAKGAALTSVADTLSNSRLSFIAAEDSGNSVGSTLVRIKLVGDSPPGWATTVKNFNLFPGETVAVGTTTTYVIDDIIDDDNDDLIDLTTGLSSDDDDADDPVIATQSARHTVTLTTTSALTNGAIRVRIAAASAGSNDGIPDKTGFDFKPMAAGYVTCPTAGGVTSWESATATASGGTGCTTGNYHCFECRYNGTLSSGQALTMYVGTTTSSQQLINPAPSSTTRTVGIADSHAFIVEHRQFPSYAAIDSTTGKITVVEAVRVTATVEPSITFTITGITANSGSYCGNTRTDASPDSTAATVPFGSLTLGAFNDAQQQLDSVTNAPGGYAVTMIENDQLSIGGDHSTELADADCDNGSCTNTTNDEWSTDTTESGFGFSIQNVDATTVPFQYSTSGGTCTGTFCARQIPATADTDSTLSIMSKTSTPTTTETIYVCYRTVASTLQAAGGYENYITFVATATF